MRNACALVLGMLAACSTTDAGSGGTVNAPDGAADDGGTGGNDDGGSGTDAGAASDGAASDGAAGAVDANKSGCKYAADKTGLNAFQQAGGLAFHVYAPSSYDPGVVHTMVVIMHGQDSDGTAELTALWQPIADTEQLVLLAPKGSRPATDPQAYPNGANWAVDDLNHVQDLVSEIDACYTIAPKKHILWGFSEGGFYGYLLGIGAATQFSGLAMGGSNTSFARQNGYPPSSETWKIPVSHVQGTSDPNGMTQTLQDKADFEAAGSVFTLYQPNQGHTITLDQVRQQYADLKGSSSP